MLKPLGDRIVVTVLEDSPQTAGGIFIPDNAKEKPLRGEVVAVGEGKLTEQGTRIPMEVSVGNIVIFAKYTGTDVKLDTQVYKVLNSQDVLAIVG